MNDKSPMCSSIRDKVIAAACLLVRLPPRSRAFCGANFIENLLRGLAGGWGSTEEKTTCESWICGGDSRPIKGLKDCRYKVSHPSRKRRGEDGAPASVVREELCLDTGLVGWPMGAGCWL
jgi:hypothetical protein